MTDKQLMKTVTSFRKGLLGKKVGEIAEIQTPGGTMNFEVISISR